MYDDDDWSDVGYGLMGYDVVTRGGQLLLLEALIFYVVVIVIIYIIIIVVVVRGDGTVLVMS